MHKLQIGTIVLEVAKDGKFPEWEVVDKGEGIIIVKCIKGPEKDKIRMVYRDCLLAEAWCMPSFERRI